MAITESIREKPRIRELEPKRRADTFRGLVCDDVFVDAWRREDESA